jgi:NADP-dependent 3-hydroxy acid dehydrogenase YdfG
MENEMSAIFNLGEDMKNLKNKVVVVTGASAGVGRAIVKEFARQGAKIGLIARGHEKLESALKEVRSLGGYGIVCALDVCDEVSLEEAAKRIEIELGPIDIWINNAMVTILGKVQDIPTIEIKRVMDVNFLGSVNGIKVATRRFLPRNHGHIIQIGSALAFIGIPLQSAYCASKHAIRAFMQSLRIELKMDMSQVKLSEIHLPAVNTPQFEWMKNYMPKHPMPVPPIFEPEVIARTVLFIVHHPRKKIWVGGSAVKAILGAKFAPWLAEWVLAKNGVKGQQTELAPPTGCNNLWEPLLLDYGTHGIFSNQAKSKSWEVWISIHRKNIATLIFIFLVLLLFMLNR